MLRPLIAMLVLAVSLSAQWLHLPTPGIPRAPDGQPDLTAPAPRTADSKPDLSGYWTKSVDRFDNNIAVDLKPSDVQPWAEALYQQRKRNLGRDSNDTKCLPMGPAYTTSPYRDSKIIQTPTLIAILHNDLTNRQIHMDGRTLEKDPNPTWMGYSIGHWEADSLVVETNGFNDKTTLDFAGHPHTEALRLTESYHRRDFGHMDVDVTFDDPGAFTKPFTVTIPMELTVDTEMLEYVCENERDNQHMIGVSDAIEGKIPAAILAAYSGIYESKEGEKLVPTEISVDDGNLMWNFKGAGKQKLDPISDTTFSLLGTTILFMRDDQGRVTHFIMRSVEEDTEVRRKN